MRQHVLFNSELPDLRATINASYRVSTLVISLFIYFMSYNVDLYSRKKKKAKVWMGRTDSYSSRVVESLL